MITSSWCVLVLFAAEKLKRGLSTSLPSTCLGKLEMKRVHTAKLCNYQYTSNPIPGLSSGTIVNQWSMVEASPIDIWDVTLRFIYLWLDQVVHRRWSHSQTPSALTCCYVYTTCMELLATWRILLLAVVVHLSVALRAGLLRRLPTRACLSRFRNDHLERRTLFTDLF